MIFLKGFKQFNSTLTKTKFRQDQAQDISKDFQSNHRSPNQHEVKSILISIPVNRGVSKTLEGVL